MPLCPLWLWPTWEFHEIRQSIETSVRANKDFLCHISAYYQNKGRVPTSYKVARKEAFLQTSNLSSAFQRMAQEPKSKQKKLDEIYELVVLNHTFLSSLSSLSTYIQQHSTTEASEGFQSAIDGIDQNLGHVLLILQDQKVKGDFPTKENEQFFKNNIAHFFDEFYEKKEDERSLIASTERHLQEAHLVLEQLKWLFSTSRKMLVLISKVSFD